MAQVSARRELNERRIRVATRGLAVGAAVATAIFGAAAARNTHAAPASTDDGDVTAVNGDFDLGDDSDEQWSLTPAQSDPQQSFAPPVASSGGS